MQRHTIAFRTGALGEEGMQRATHTGGCSGASSPSEMAVGWQQVDMERCLVQACYRRRGVANYEEVTWLHLPQGWQVAAGRDEAHTRTEIEGGEGSAECGSALDEASCSR